jgi:hypothetical protein
VQADLEPQYTHPSLLYSLRWQTQVIVLSYWLWWSSHKLCSGWPWTMNFQIVTSQIVWIIGMRTQCLHWSFLSLFSWVQYFWDFIHLSFWPFVWLLNFWGVVLPCFSCILCVSVEICLLEAKSLVGGFNHL